MVNFIMQLWRTAAWFKQWHFWICQVVPGTYVDYADGDFEWFSSVILSECWDSVLK